MNSSTIYTARTEDLVVEEVGAEVLVYDKRSDVAHCLTSFAAAVWRRCEHGAELDALVQATTGEARGGDPEHLVLVALAELSEKELLETTAGVSRREAVRRLAGMGMAAAAVPMVVSAAVATPAMATSPGTQAQGSVCTADFQCSGSLVCTSGGSTSGTKYCNVSTCTKSGAPTATTGVRCTASSCCSGLCSGSGSSAVCADHT